MIFMRLVNTFSVYIWYFMILFSVSVMFVLMLVSVIKSLVLVFFFNLCNFCSHIFRFHLIIRFFDKIISIWYFSSSVFRFNLFSRFCFIIIIQGFIIRPSCATIFNLYSWNVLYKGNIQCFLTASLSTRSQSF